jgi:hypothetical protein
MRSAEFGVRPPSPRLRRTRSAEPKALLLSRIALWRTSWRARCGIERGPQHGCVARAGGVDFQVMGRGMFGAGARQTTRGGRVCSPGSGGKRWEAVKEESKQVKMGTVPSLKIACRRFLRLTSLGGGGLHGFKVWGSRFKVEEAPASAKATAGKLEKIALKMVQKGTDDSPFFGIFRQIRLFSPFYGGGGKTPKSKLQFAPSSIALRLSPSNNYLYILG